MKRLLLAAVLLASVHAAACGPRGPVERYGFITRLGNDTVSLEDVTRQGSTLTVESVDRFPRVRQRHTVVKLNDDGSIRHLAMDIHTPSEPAAQRDRHVEAEVSRDAITETKRDSATLERKFAPGGLVAMAHVPQMYSLYELYFQYALKHAADAKLAIGDTVRMRQFYIDREFDKFSLHYATVKTLADHHAMIWHDWLSGEGEATLDSANRLLSYSGRRSTYQVAVERLNAPPDVKGIGDRYAALETQTGMKQLSVRDTVRASIAPATFTVDYGRPLARGRNLLGGVIPFDHVWRTGANAATQFTTSAPITIGTLAVPAGAYTLWTIPRRTGVELVVNKQTGQWGTEYGPAHDLGRVAMTQDSTATPVEQFTIAIDSAGAKRGAIVMSWGSFRWSAPFVVR